MEERKSPKKAAARPLTMLPEENVATTVEANTARAKYSGAPKRMAAMASSGAQVTRATPLKVPQKRPPAKEATVPGSEWPRCMSGKASTVGCRRLPFDPKIMPRATPEQFGVPKDIHYAGLLLGQENLKKAAEFAVVPAT